MFSLTHPPRNLNELVGDARRVALGIAYALRPCRLPSLPFVAAAVLRAALGLERPGARLNAGAPPPSPAARGFVGLCGSLEPTELMAGFRRGYYPTSHVGRKKWWLHANRMVMAPHEMVIEKDVRRLLRNKRFRVTFDTAFEEVMIACASPRAGHVPLTWITRDIIAAYDRLHRLGRAHSFEVWNGDGQLVGGGFGIAVGPVFVIESQFTVERNASKVGLATLLQYLSRWGFTHADGKGHTPHLERLGFHPVSHNEYVAAIRAGADDVGPVGRWRVDEQLNATDGWEPVRPGPSLRVIHGGKVSESASYTLRVGLG